MHVHTTNSFTLKATFFGLYKKTSVIASIGIKQNASFPVRSPIDPCKYGTRSAKNASTMYIFLFLILNVIYIFPSPNTIVSDSAPTIPNFLDNIKHD